VVCGRGTQSKLRARGRWLAWSSGPSTSPLVGGLRPRGPVEIAGPRPLVGVVVRPLNFTVRARQERRQSMEALRNVLLTVVIFAAAWGIYSRVHTPRGSPAISPPQSQRLDSQSDASESQQSPFRCDGRTYCSQMTSCAEAKYFLAHCPNVKMDGDHNGIPCERQWCPRG